MIYKSHKTLMFYGAFLFMKNLTKIAANTEGPLYVLFYIFTTLFHSF
jgi:hypothetical protein